MRLFCGTSLFTFVCLCVIEQIVEHLKESPLLSCFCSAFPSLQIRPRSLWFQTNNSWPDLLTTWLFLRTDKHSILSHPLLHHLSDTEFYGRKPLVSRTLHTHSSVFLSDGASIFLFSVLLLELINHRDIGQFRNGCTCTNFTSALKYDTAVNIVNYYFSA